MRFHKKQTKNVANCHQPAALSIKLYWHQAPLVHSGVDGGYLLHGRAHNCSRDCLARKSNDLLASIYGNGLEPLKQITEDTKAQHSGPEPETDSKLLTDPRHLPEETSAVDAACASTAPLRNPHTLWLPLKSGCCSLSELTSGQTPLKPNQTLCPLPAPLLMPGI